MTASGPSRHFAATQRSSRFWNGADIGVALIEPDFWVHDLDMGVVVPPGCL